MCYYSSMRSETDCALISFKVRDNTNMLTRCTPVALGFYGARWSVLTDSVCFPRMLQYCHTNHVVFNGSAPPVGGCTTKTRTCLMLKKLPTSEVSVWRKSSSVTVTAQNMSTCLKAKVKGQHSTSCFLLIVYMLHILICFLTRKMNVLNRVNVFSCECFCPMCCRLLL